MDLILEDRNGDRHRVGWHDAPEEFFVDQLPYFSIQTEPELALGVRPKDRPESVSQRKAPRRRFVRLEELATDTWLYREA